MMIIRCGHSQHYNHYDILPSIICILEMTMQLAPVASVAAIDPSLVVDASLSSFRLLLLCRSHADSS